MKIRIDGFSKLIDEITKGSVTIIESPGDLGLLIAKNIGEESNSVAFIHERQIKQFQNFKLKILGKDIFIHELYAIPLVVKDTEEDVVVFTILPQIYITHGGDKTYKTLAEIAKEIREASRILVATIDLNILDEKTIAMLESEADYIVEISEIIKEFKITRGIRIKKSLNDPPSDFYRFYIKDLRVGERIE